ncbi:hypothetical protein Aduo_018941 [Ancylostoma duodenale]
MVNTRPRTAFHRAVTKNMPAANMDDVPDHLRLRPDDTTFLYLKTQEMQIYFSQEVISRAVSNGLYVLAADGIHSSTLKTRGTWWCRWKKANSTPSTELLEEASKCLCCLL